jgi:DNA-binding MarR family transcriptional regulator
MSRAHFVDEAVDGWSRIHPDVDLTALEAVHRLVWSGRLAEDILERTAIASSLRRRGDYEVLALLRQQEPARLTPLEVAQHLQTSPSGMTGKLDRLEEQGLIERSRDSHDRRAVRLGITDAGRTVISAAFDANLTVYGAMLADFTTAEARKLDRLLNKLLTRLDALTELEKPWAPG